MGYDCVYAGLAGLDGKAYTIDAASPITTANATIEGSTSLLFGRVIMSPEVWEEPSIVLRFGMGPFKR